MGTVPYHRHKADELLNRADCAIALRDPLILSSSKEAVSAPGFFALSNRHWSIMVCVSPAESGFRQVMSCVK